LVLAFASVTTITAIGVSFANFAVHGPNSVMNVAGIAGGTGTAATGRLLSSTVIVVIGKTKKRPLNGGRFLLGTYIQWFQAVHQH